MAKHINELEALEIVAALSESSAHTQIQRDALRAVIALAGSALIDRWMSYDANQNQPNN